MLWDNKYILIGRGHVACPTWKNAGIRYINDILHEHQPRFLSHTELTEEFGISVSFLNILQIRTALSRAWKRKILNPAVDETDGSPHIFSTDEQGGVKVVGKTLKFLYTTIIKQM